MTAERLRHCTACREYLPVASFPVSRGRTSRRCFGCLMRADHLEPAFRRAVERATGIKRCRRCERDLPLASFPKRGHRSGTPATSNRCADCLNEARWRREGGRQRGVVWPARRLAELARYGLVP